MEYIFIATGGSGSSYFVKCLNKKYKIDSKPDTYFVKKGQPFTKKKNNYHQLLGSDGIDSFPELNAIKGFASRTDFQMNSSKTISANLKDYIDSLKADPIKTAIFNSMPKFNFFVKNGISNLVCLVRHPLHAYLSFTKKNRHFNLIEKTGGVNSKKSIDYYVDAWNSIVSQHLGLVNKGSICLRYEFFNDDLSSTSLPKKIFDGWDGSYRNKGLTSENEKYLRSQVEENYFRIYSEWDI